MGGVENDVDGVEAVSDGVLAHCFFPFFGFGAGGFLGVLTVGVPFVFRSQT